MSLVRRLPQGIRVALAALVLMALGPRVPAQADPLADFHAAVEEASGQYQAALTTLETSGREETSAAVHRLRQTWQSLAQRFAAEPPAALAGGDQFAGEFMQTDMQMIGVLLVIDLGNRDAARAGLLPIGATLSRLRERSAPPAR
jgi:hypothetical protein